MGHDGGEHDATKNDRPSRIPIDPKRRRVPRSLGISIDETTMPLQLAARYLRRRQVRCVPFDTTGNTPGGVRKAPCPAPCAKIFLFLKNGICASLGRPALTKEALRGRHETWCGMRWTRWCRRRAISARTVKPCGPDPPTLGSSEQSGDVSPAGSTRRDLFATGASKPGTPGRARSSR